MAKLPNALLPRGLLPPSSSSSSSSSSTLLLSTTTRPTMRIQPNRTIQQHQQIRCATEVVRPKRPFTWTQIIQLSDGSTYTSRSTSPLPVYRSTKDTRNHLTWQPSEASLQNIEMDEAGKLASFRERFGTGYDLGPGAAEEDKTAAAAAAAADSGKQGKKADGKKDKKEEAKEAKAAEAAEAAEEEEEDSFSRLMATYVVDQPQLKGGQVAAKSASKKGKKK